MDGVDVQRSSKKARLWLSARRKKKGAHRRRGKENESPNNRPASDVYEPKRRELENNTFTVDAVESDNLTGPVVTLAQIHHQEPILHIISSESTENPECFEKEAYKPREVQPQKYLDCDPKGRKIEEEAFTVESVEANNLAGGQLVTMTQSHYQEPPAHLRSNNTPGVIDAKEKIVKPLSHVPNLSGTNADKAGEESNSINSMPEDLDFSRNSTTSTSSTYSSLCVELETDQNHNNIDEEINEISGRRIFNVQYLFEQMAAIDHTPFNCTFKDLRFVAERRSGFQSTFKFTCKMCGTKETFSNENSNSKINQNIVQAVVCSGSGFAQLEEFSAHLDMPCMVDKTFMKENMLLGDVLKDIALDSMYKAGFEEKELAIKKGQVDSDGIPCISVVVDASWGKRSYRGSCYNSLSGVACIMGFETRKVLFLGVRNSYCSVCALASNKKIEPKNHKCFRNWSGTSTAMEADGVVEGFKCSIDMHGLKYTKIIGDGDSSVKSALNETLPYGHTTMIQKIECSNHLLRNYCSKLRNLTKKTENRHGIVPVTLRKCLENNVLRLRKAIKGAVDHTSKLPETTFVEKVNILKQDLRNGPCHVFGDHSSCKPYFCQGLKLGEENLVTSLKECGLWYDIFASISPILNNSESLLMGKTNNIVEQFNSIIAKFIGGKRINYSLRGSYESRCYAAAAKHNTGSLLKPLYQTEDDKRRTFSKRFEERCRKRLRRIPNENRRWKRTKRSMEADESYGDLEREADLETDIFEKKKEQFLKSLEKAPDELNQIERETIGQATNPKWVKERKLRLTASIFGQVCKMRSSTSCESTIKTLLYSCFKGSDATRYGNRNEPIAIKETEELLGIQIESCGLFIDHAKPYLGASPDGLIGQDTIIEIKCPAVAANMTPREAIIQKKITFCTLNDTESRQITLKRNHNYFYQVQGQLNITKRKYCYFLVWTPSGILIEKVERDDMFWKRNVNILQCFYMECVLPEIVDPRLPRKLPIRDRSSKINKPT